MRETTVASLFVLLAACSAAAPPKANAGDGNTSAPSSGPTSAAVGEAPSGKPAGKMSAQMVGKVSPIGGFIGQGKGWRIEIHALDATQHDVVLKWTQPARADSGTVRYDGALDAPRNTPFALEGRLQTPAGTQAVRIDIRSAPCTDDQGTLRPQTIALTLDERQRLEGCGDLAMF